MWTYPLKTMHVYSRGQLSVSHLVAAKDTLQSSSPSTWRQFSYLELFHGWSLWQEIDVIELLFFLFGILMDAELFFSFFFLWSSVCPLAWSWSATCLDLPLFICPVLVGIATVFWTCVRGSGVVGDMLVTLAPNIMSYVALISISLGRIILFREDVSM